MTVPLRVLAGTGNAGKLSEIREILAPSGVVVVSPQEVGWNADAPENGDTLEENALQKAREAARVTGIPSLADDTGLFVDALHGEPGVRSARYAGEERDEAANRRKLLAALDGVPEERRGAAFRCVVAFVEPGRGDWTFSGECRGRITARERGTGGFGYDPVFQVVETGRTFAEMSAKEKNVLSHRGRALAALRAHLSARAS